MTDSLFDDIVADPTDSSPLVQAARQLADELLAPRAADVDAGSVPATHLAALGSAGLLGLAAPARVGGAAAPPPVVRRVTEVLAGADLATWFVQVQHHGPVGALAAVPGEAFDALLADLAAGRRVAGVAFSHLRRWPGRPVTATPRGDGGWRLDGVAPWYTGWGLNDTAFVAGAGADGQVVFGVIPARPGPGLRATEPLDVAALRAARTVTLTLEGVTLRPADVASVVPISAWLEADAARTANVNPAVFGVTAAALRLLLAEGAERGEPAARDAALRLAETWRVVRDRAYHLLDDEEPTARIDDRLRLRARAHQVLVEATTALVVSGAGGSMAVTSPAQRKAREAMFLHVQAQTKASRIAHLEAIGRGEDHPV